MGDKMNNNNYELIRLPEIGFVRLSTILILIPIGRSTWWHKVKLGEYPQPVKLGTRTTAWKVEDIRSLISSFTT